jgi:Sec7 domain
MAALLPRLPGPGLGPVAAASTLHHDDIKVGSEGSIHTHSLIGENGVPIDMDDDVPQWIWKLTDRKHRSRSADDRIPFPDLPMLPIFDYPPLPPLKEDTIVWRCLPCVLQIPAAVFAHEVTPFLSIRDICRFSTLCRAARVIAQSEVVWRSTFCQLVGPLASQKIQYKFRDAIKRKSEQHEHYTQVMSSTKIDDKQRRELAARRDRSQHLFWKCMCAKFMQARQLFNENPLQWKEFWQNHVSMIESAGDQQAVVEFLLRQRRTLSPWRLGEFLCDFVHHPERNSDALLRCFVSNLDFRDLEVDYAARAFLAIIGLPQSSQAINNLIDALAHEYVKQNPGIFADVDAAHVLFFSMMLLSSDLHSKSSPPRRGMSLNGFIDNLRGLNGGADFAYEFLRRVYENISFAPLMMVPSTSYSGTVYMVSGSIFFMKKYQEKYLHISNGMVRLFCVDNESGVHQLERLFPLGVGHVSNSEVYDPSMLDMYITCPKQKGKYFPVEIRGTQTRQVLLTFYLRTNYERRQLTPVLNWNIQAKHMSRFKQYFA